MTLGQIPDTGWTTSKLRDHRSAGAICERMKDAIKVSHMANYCNLANFLSRQLSIRLSLTLPGPYLAPTDGRSGCCESQYCELSPYPVIRAPRDVSCCVQANALIEP